LIRILVYYLKLDGEIKNEFNLKNTFAGGKSTLFLKFKEVLQDQKGYLSSDNNPPKYLGNDQNYFIRYKFEANNNFRIGFTAEKDFGERFFNAGSKRGFDFYSGYMSIDHVGKYIEKIVIGDYSISLGQGLILQNNFGAGKSAFVMNIKSGGKPIKPYSSVNESNYFRGAAIHLNLKPNINMVFFGSQKNIDGTIINEETNPNNQFENITTIARSGYHRTASEIEKQGNIIQQNAGTKFGIQFSQLRINFQHVIYKFNLPFTKSDDLYKKYQFSSSQLQNSSIDYNYHWKNLNLFGEIARSDNNAYAQLHGLLLPLDRRVDMSLSYRNYNEKYQVLEGNSFSEGSQPINEKGLYWAIEARPNNFWKLSSYVDYWTNPWLRYRVDAPAKGKEFLFRAEYTIRRKFSAYLQFRSEQKMQNANLINNKIDPILPINTERMRIHFQSKISKEIELRSRAEMAWHRFNKTSSTGYLIYQDLIYKPIMKPISLSMRYSIFDTKSFDTRIYSYENDILYEFAIPFVYGSGQRYYCNLRYRPLRNLTLEARYAATKYNRQAKIGSGNDEIIGNLKSDVKIQMRVEF
jgi:hypothetical protein